MFGATALLGPEPLHSRAHKTTHNDATHSVRLLWMSDQLVTDLYLTTHNTHKRKKSMPPVGFETTISVGERQQTYAFDSAATGTGRRAE